MASGFSAQKKIFDGITIEFDRLLAYWRFKGYKIVFTNGCFDILHLGHIDYLYKAAELGDVLIVGLNSDASVNRIKGEGRPINGWDARAHLLASLQMIDAVVKFEDDTPFELIKHITPDILVKGADYKPENIIGADWVMDNGGEVITLPYLKEYSTTLIEERIRQGR